MITKIKRPVSILLVLMMIIGMFTMVPISAGATEDTITVFFTDSEGWGNVYVYGWNDSGDTTIAFPGKSMNSLYTNTTYSQNVYGATIPASTSKILFSKGDNSGKTPDITDVVDGGWWYYDNASNAGWVGSALHAATAPTEEAPGNIKYYELDGHYYNESCSSISADQTVIPVLHTHTWDYDNPVWGTPTGEWASDGEVTVTLNCTGCDETRSATAYVRGFSAEETPATCGTDGSFSAIFETTVDGHELVSDRLYWNIEPANGEHMFSSHYAEVPATYNAAGREEYWECAECGKLFSDEEMTQEIAEPVVIPMLQGVASVNGVNYGTFAEAAAASHAANEAVITPLVDLNTLTQPVYTMDPGEVLNVKYVAGYNVMPAVSDPAYKAVYTTYQDGSDYVFHVTTDKYAVKYTNAAGVSTYTDSLPSAFSTGTYQLQKNITRTSRMTPGSLASNVTLDLNGFTLTSTATDYGILLSRNGEKTFTLTDTSTNGGGKLVANDLANTSTASVISASGKNNTIIIDNVTIEATQGIALLSEGQTLTITDSDITVTGTDFGLATNGSSTKDATIIVTDSSITSTQGIGVYLPGDAEATFTDTDVTGTTAMYIKGGDVTIDGGSYTATGAKADYSYNGNGANPTGDAIVVENAGSAYPANDVTIKDGTTFTSANNKALALYTKEDDAAVDVTLDEVTVPSAYGVDNATFTFANGATITDVDIPADSKIQENADGSITVVPKNYVAQVGDDKFESIEEAIAAAGAKGTAATVTVLADCSIDEQVTLPATADVTIDFNGNTVTVNVHKGIVNNGALTLCDTSEDAVGGMHGTGKGGLVDSTGTLTINSGLYTSENVNATNSTCAFYIHGEGSTATVDGGIVATVGYAFYVYTKAAITVNAGTISSVKQAAISGNGNSGNGEYVINVKGGSLSSDENVAIYHPNNGTLNVTGGTISGPTAIYIKSGATAVGATNIQGATISGTGAKADYSYDGNGCNPTGDAIVVDSCGYPGNEPSVTIKSGIITSTNAHALGAYIYGDNDLTVTLDGVVLPSAYAAEDVTIAFANGATITDLDIPADCKLVDNGDGTKTVVPKDYVAQVVGGDKYESIADAVANAASGDTITFLADCAAGNITIPADKALTIDFADKTVTVGSAYDIENYGTLTVTGTTGGLTGPYGLIDNYGTLTVAGGVYNATTNNYSKAAIWNNENATMTVSGGTINSTCYGIYVGTGNTLTVSGGSITSTNAAAISGNGSTGQEGYNIIINGGTIASVNSVAIYHPNAGNLTINDGTITGPTAIYVKAGNLNVTDGADVSLNGGTITGTGTGLSFEHSGDGCNPTGDALVIENCGYPGGTPVVAITGGTFEATGDGKAVASYGYDTYEAVENFVSGGTFSTAVPEEYCAEGYIPKDNGDGTYGVIEHTHVYDIPSFNWTQDATTGDWDCDTLTMTCICGDYKEYEVTGFFGASVVKCTANADGSFTYSVSKKVDGVTYSDSKTLDAQGVIMSSTQLKAAAAKGGSWELGADIDGAVGISCVNGFELDGNNHTVTRHANISTNAVFVAKDKNSGFTLKNLTIDGIEGQADLKPAVASAQTNPNSGNIINLNNVKIINYDFDEANNGVVLAWGRATVNMTNCDIKTASDYDIWAGSLATVNINGGTYGNIYLHSYSGSGAILNMESGYPSVRKIELDLTVTDRLKANINSGIISELTANGKIPKEVVVRDRWASTLSAPEGYRWIESEEGGDYITLANAKLFVGHSITPKGDVSVNFYIDPELLTIPLNQADTAVVKFSWDGGTETAEVDLKALTPEEGTGYLIATCSVPIAHMAHEITATVVENGTIPHPEIDRYSVQQYAETIIAGDYSATLKTMMEEMLNYGAMAQIVFDSQLTDKPELANVNLSTLDPSYDYDATAAVTANDIAGAIKGSASNLQTVASDNDIEFVTSTVVFLSKSTLRHWFAAPGKASLFPEGQSQQNYFYYVEKTNIPANGLDEQQQFNIGNETFTYSALDYAVAVVGSNAAGESAKNLVKAMYLYNQAANAYYGDIPA